VAGNNWKTTPITLGLLIAMLAGTFFIVRATRSGEEEIKTITKEVLVHHCEKDVDVAHPGISSRYAKKQEIREAVYQVNERLGRIEVVQQQILKRIDRAHRRRPPR
jgi:hypothetical protein